MSQYLFENTISKLCALFLESYKDQNNQIYYNQSKKALLTTIDDYVIKREKRLSCIKNAPVVDKSEIIIYKDKLSKLNAVLETITSYDLLFQSIHQITDLSSELDKLVPEDTNIKQNIMSIYTIYIDNIIPNGEICVCKWKTYINRQLLTLCLKWSSGNQIFTEKIDRFNHDLVFYGLKFESDNSFKNLCDNVCNLDDQEYIIQIARYLKFTSSIEN